MDYQSIKHCCWASPGNPNISIRNEELAVTGEVEAMYHHVKMPEY